MLEYLLFSLKESADKKKNREGKLEKLLRRTVVAGMRMTSRTPWTTTNKLEAGPAGKGGGNEGQVRRSHVCFFGLVATCDDPGTCPTKKLPLFLNLIQMRPRKNEYRISEIPRPGRYRTNINSKNRKKMFFSLVRVCQLSTRTYHVSYIRAEIPSHS